MSGPTARLAGAAALLGMVCFVAPAAAHGWLECEGEPIRWATRDVPVQVMQCAAPAGSHRAADLLAGVDAWNAVPGLGVSLVPVPSSPTCRITVNGHSELGYVRPDQLDGARGATRVVYDHGCGMQGEGRTAYGPQSIVEADVIIADFPTDVSGEPENCDRIERNQPLRRALVLHELGHVLGLWHEDDQVAVMNASSSSVRYCGARALVPHPDDGAGARTLYPDPDAAPVRDVAATAMWLERSNYNATVVPRGTVAVCPGELVPVRWAAANLGTVDAVTTVRWFISDNDLISQRDRPAGTIPDVVLPAGSFVTEAHDLRIPRGLQAGPNETLWVGFMVDADRSDWELAGSNNGTYTAMRLLLRPPDLCP